jgi:glycosyltransferase involved in cell wall biosynthesis
MATILFYKQLVALGGAEVLLEQHYAWLKAKGEEVFVYCFKHAEVERINIDPPDLKVIRRSTSIAQTFGLARLLRRHRGDRIFCHSGPVEFGLAALLAGGVGYGIFVHQPTTMSFNEYDKFTARYWPRYQAFARHDAMYDQLCAQRAGMSWLQRLYVELRAPVLQTAYRQAKALYVLSNFAVREKREIFGLNPTFLAGAISPDRVAALAEKPDLRPLQEPIELVSVSRMDKNKRIEILIDAVAELRARGRRVRLRLGGKGPATEDLRAHATTTGVADAVEFLGFVPEDDIPALYASMDLFVTIDWADYRITTYEVLAENRRVIVSNDTDADPELLMSGYFFVAAPKSVDLADSIEHALETPVAWDRAKLAKYLTTFTWPVYFERVTQALEGNSDIRAAQASGSQYA